MLSNPTLPTSDSARSLLASKLRSPTRAPAADIHRAVASDATLSPASTPSSSTAPQKGQQPQPPLPHYEPPQPLPSTSNHTFERPRKRIVSPASLRRFQASGAFSEIMGLAVALNETVKGKKLTDENVSSSPVVQSILSVLDTVDQLVTETPPVENAASRFGNPAFRDFYRKVKSRSQGFHESIVGLAEIKGDGEVSGLEEIKVYLEESWGNEERIDYGSGMELNFLCWILCLVKLSLLSIAQDGASIVLRIFWRYITVMRHIQSTYWLEPAGSHGVWGLDDYHFLPFVWGSGQLVPHRHLRPKSIHDKEVTEEFSPDYMYLACIRFINEIKTASLRWHSPMLDDISGVRTWSKVNEGMLKMYKAEVLSKLPIAQHIFFGSLIAFPPSEDGSEEADEAAQVDPCGHGHAHGTGEGQAAGWGDCCGIPIPSAFAAAQDEKEKAKTGSGVAVGGGVRRVPFD